jgi:hypothetical protein
MIVAVLEAIMFVLVIASTSLLCGLLRTAKTASQATEEQQLVSGDDQSALQEQSKDLETLRTAS